MPDSVEEAAVTHAYEGEGTLLWDPEAGRAHSLSLELDSEEEQAAASANMETRSESVVRRARFMGASENERRPPLTRTAGRSPPSTAVSMTDYSSAISEELAPEGAASAEAPVVSSARRRARRRAPARSS